MNELKHQTSPYLLQHANNPVHWKAWGKTALETAQKEQKLIVISIGYAACHWCHVMEHETFEDEEAAAVMNQNFVSIKIDREERPDIDAIYMKAVQLMTRQGGWPLNVVALPDGRPIWGGTYFRTGDWIEALEQLAALHQNNPAKIEEYAQRLHEGIVQSNLIPPSVEENIGIAEIVNKLTETWKKSFDPDFGGNARAPKFMLPDNWEFLLLYALRYQDDAVLEHVFLTLDKMALGGLFDTVHGGFSRYSVDLKWHVPHFEKMLYDNGLLLSLFAKAHAVKPSPLYRETLEKTVRFLFEELRSQEGCFYASLDADSLDVHGKSTEGAYYVWTQPELKSILDEQFDWFSQVYNINEFGHWEHGNYVLIRLETDDFWANRFGMSEAEFRKLRNSWEEQLKRARDQRTKPGLDNKILTSWNAIAIHGLCEAFKALKNEEYRDAAQRAMAAVLRKNKDAEGYLLHQPESDHQHIRGFLDDYAFMMRALLGLYQITSQEDYLLEARQLLDFCLDHFYDPDQGYFLYNADLDQELIAAHFEMEDNVIPASNAIMADMLLQLGVHFENAAYTQLGKQMVMRVITNVDYPSAFSHWLQLGIALDQPKKEVVFCGENALKMALEFQKYYNPEIHIAIGTKPSNLPLLRNRFVPGETLVYVCENNSCSLPMKSLDEVLKLLS